MGLQPALPIVPYAVGMRRETSLAICKEHMIHKGRGDHMTIRTPKTVDVPVARLSDRMLALGDSAIELERRDVCYHVPHVDPLNERRH
jgi:hypothetical protein